MSLVRLHDEQSGTLVVAVLVEALRDVQSQQVLVSAARRLIRILIVMSAAMALHVIEILRLLLVLLCLGVEVLETLEVLFG